MFKNTYQTLAISLTITGIAIAATAYFIINSTPLTAFGLSTILIGTVTYAISKGQPKIPPQASAILLQSSLDNTAALIEELGLKTKAIYLPKTITGDKPKALIPLTPNTEINKKKLPKRLIVKYGPTTQEMGLLLTTPGSTITANLEPKTDYTATDLETAVSEILLGTINLADGVRATITSEKILIEIINPRLEPTNMWVNEYIGSPIASIVASTITQTLNKPVTIQNEQYSKNKVLIELKTEGNNL